MSDEDLWYLGASDTEMEVTGDLLRAAGQTVRYAMVDGKRVHPGNAYEATAPDGAWTVECCRPPIAGSPGLDLDDLFTRGTDMDRHIDHHRPGDPGYGRPPAEFLLASSIGQVIAELARRGVLPDTWPHIGWRLADGGCQNFAEIEPYDGRRISCRDSDWWEQLHEELCKFGSPGLDIDDLFARGADGEWWVWETHGDEAGGTEDYWRQIPHDIVLTAAADHCLGAAYRGECPGVDPDELMRWRAGSRAAFQQRPVDAVLADVEATTAALRAAPVIMLAPGVEVADMRREPPHPELPEAATRAGIGYISGPLPCPDGRRKYTCSGSPEQVRAFLAHWGPARLVDLYGDPERGFAGGYLP